MESKLHEREQGGFGERRQHAGEGGADEPVSRDESEAETAVDQERGAQYQDRRMVVTRRDKQSLCRAGGSAGQQTYAQDGHNGPGTDEIGAERHEQGFAERDEQDGEDQRGEES